MVDAARQMLDELMGRNRNLHPSEAGHKVNWEDPEFCQFYNVRFCPHDLFINTRADLGPCSRIHDDEARHLYEEARPSARKRQYEDEFLRFCNVMLHDVDRKIQKGKQRLQLMQRDQPAVAPLSRQAEQLANLNGRINKLLAEAEEAGIRGDVDQAQDLMTLCEELKEEKEKLTIQYEAAQRAINSLNLYPEEETSGTNPSSNEAPAIQDAAEEATASPPPIETSPPPPLAPSASENAPDGEVAGAVEPTTTTPVGEAVKTEKTWGHESLPEKQMKVCEICGAFLIVGDAQQRIEDHLMGKQHLGYSKLRTAVAEINDARQKEREQEDRSRRRDGRVQRFHSSSYEGRREPRSEYRERSRDYVQNRQPSDRRHHHHKSHHSGSHHSYSRSGGSNGGGGGTGGGNRSSRHHNHHNRHDSRERHGRSRSRSRY
ncbi:luc7-like protein 3 [Drosophila bipectinata]|uniref:luc7-like protein 3 n=1 Tax=Drosophila bipectinata TaxID=42026 RepID=UPI001C8A3181|nr:luc7-like protein 3 [Drosophila bipectinata]